MWDGSHVIVGYGVREWQVVSCLSPDVIIDLLLFELCILSCCYSNSIAKLDRKFGRVKRISRGGLTCSIMPNRRDGERW